MKVNTKNADSLFEKSIAKFPFNSGKKPLMQDRFNKSFSFSIYSPLFKKCDEVLAFLISKGFNSIWHVLLGAASNFAICFRREFIWINLLHI